MGSWITDDSVYFHYNAGVQSMLGTHSLAGLTKGSLEATIEKKIFPN